MAAPPTAWHAYLEAIVSRAEKDPGRIILRGHSLSEKLEINGPLRAWFGAGQLLASPDSLNPVEPMAEALCRDVSQTLVQALDTRPQPQTVFLSHTKHTEPKEREALAAFVTTVRRIIGTTHLNLFFDSNTLQPGDDWARELEAKAATSAMMVLRTDRYASRDWCQREVATAKRHGMPVVVLDALDGARGKPGFVPA